MKTKWWMFGLDAPLETPPPAVEVRPPSNLHRKNDVGDIVSELIFVKNQEEWLARNAKLAVIEEELRVAEAKRAKNGGVDVKVSLPESLMGPLGSILGRSRRWLEKKKKSLQQEMVDCARLEQRERRPALAHASPPLTTCCPCCRSTARRRRRRRARPSAAR